MMFLITIKQVSTLFIFFLIGFGLAKLKILPIETPNTLAKMEINLFIPCLVFESFSANCNSTLMSQNVPLMITSLITWAIVLPVGTFVGRKLGKEKYQKNICIYTLNVPNTAYLGSALVLALFGSVMLTRMLLFTLPLIVYTYTIGYNDLVGKTKISLKSLITPPFISILFGATFGLLSISLPDIIINVITGCRECMAPLAMILTGCVIAEFNLKEILCDKLTYIMVALRLVVSPLIILTVGKLFKVDPEIMIILCATFSMPTGLNTVVLPATVNEDCRFGAGMACISNILAIATIPFFFSVFCS